MAEQKKVCLGLYRHDGHVLSAGNRHSKTRYHRIIANVVQVQISIMPVVLLSMFVIPARLHLQYNGGRYGGIVPLVERDGFYLTPHDVFMETEKVKMGKYPSLSWA
jgi:hypothetical protein